MKTVIVTGGAGFIGSHTVVELVGAGYRPVIIDNFSNSKRSVIDRINELAGQAITCYEQDFKDIEKLKQVIEKEQPNGIIHFAAFKAVGESVSEPLKYYKNNVSGLINMLELLTSSIMPLILSSLHHARFMVSQTNCQLRNLPP